MAKEHYMEKYARARKDAINRTTLQISHKDKIYEPVVLDNFELKQARKGEPSKLTFTLLRGAEVDFIEGDAVRFRISHTWLFFGWIFTREIDEDGNIKCTCYDQIRYLKNKDTYIYENKKASELIKMIAKDFGLKCGYIEDTKYKIAGRIEEDKCLIDIILNALDETLAMTGKLYVLYDNFGKLMLKNIEDMAFDLVIDNSTIMGYDYKATIDNEVYNQVKLAYPNKETGKYDISMVKDSKNIKQWGVLQYYKKIDDKTNAAAMAEQLLLLYNNVKRSITIKDALGDVRVRPGTRILVNLDLGDYKLKSYMIVENMIHRYKDGLYTMDMDLINKDFSAESYNPNTSTANSLVDNSGSGGGSSLGELNGRKVKARFSAYCPKAEGSIGGGPITASGEKINYTLKTCAAPSCIPFGTLIQINGTGTKYDGSTFKVNDRGGAIKVLSDGTYRFDLLMPSGSEMKNFGMRNGYAIVGDGTGFHSVGSLGGNSKAVEYAKSRLGCRYVWGAQGPNTFDCSGLMYWVAKQLGKTIPRTSKAQSQSGMPVSKANLLPGDLVFFANKNGVHHVGMFIGGGQFIHSPQTGDVVKISKLSSRKDFYCARRYF